MVHLVCQIDLITNNMTTFIELLYDPIASKFIILMTWSLFCEKTNLMEALQQMLEQGF